MPSPGVLLICTCINTCSITESFCFLLSQQPIPAQPFEKTHTLSTAGISSNGAYWGDVDADGDLDVLFRNGDPGERLYLNDGAGGFSLAEHQPATADEGWQDVDNDGDLDVFSQMHIHDDLIPDYVRGTVDFGDYDFLAFQTIDDVPAMALYRNDGDFFFTLTDEQFPVLQGAAWCCEWPVRSAEITALLVGNETMLS